MRNIIWTLSNLCRNKNPAPPFDIVKTALPTLNRLLTCPDRDILGDIFFYRVFFMILLYVISHKIYLNQLSISGQNINTNLYFLADACWALSYLTDGSNDKIQIVLESGIVPQLVALLTSEEGNVLTPALRTVGNIVTGDDAQTDSIISAGGLTHLCKLLSHSRKNIVKEAAWAISNITAGNIDQIQRVINAGILLPLIDILQKVSVYFIHIYEPISCRYVSTNTTKQDYYLQYYL